MNIRSIHRAYRISWKNKQFMYTRIRKQYHERKLQLDRIKDTRISKIRNTIIPTTNKKTLLVGINYEGTSSELKGCVNDVYDLRDMLISKYNYNPKTIQLLINTKATRKNNIGFVYYLVTIGK